MADQRIIELPTSVDITSDDYVAIDSNSSGTRKYSLFDMINRLAQTETLAEENKESAERANHYVDEIDEFVSAIQVELMNLRMDINGTVHDSAGNAVRNQIAEVRDTLAEYVRIFRGRVDDAVEAWLDAHPEATTTVADGSITNDKLDSNLKNAVDIVKTIQPLQKKVLAMTGAIKELSRDVKKASAYASYTISQIATVTNDNNEVTGKHLTVSIGKTANRVSFDMLETNPTNYGTIKFLRGYGTNYRNRLYLLNDEHWQSAVDTSVAEVKLYFDGVEKTLDQLNVGDEFESLIVFKRMSNNKVYIHELDSAGIKLLILTDVADFTKSQIYANGAVKWDIIFDKENVTIYRNQNTGRLVTFYNDATWTANKWFKVEIHW